MRMNVFGLAAVLAATLTLAACGGDDDDTQTAAETTPPAMQATPPAMQATPPAMTAAPPATPVTPPTTPVTPPTTPVTPPAAGQLTLAAITGRWATSPVACGVPAEETIIATETITRGAVTCTINSATPGLVGLQLALSCTGGAAPTTETWTVAAPSVAPPVTAIGITAGTDVQALVRCP
jgi:hypothetical protein